MKMNTIIRTYLDDRGLRHGFVADRAGIDPKKFSRIMTCRQKLNLDEYEAICTKGLHLSPSYFFENYFLDSSNSA